MATKPTTHVVLFPFPAHGHLGGMLTIARLIRRSFPEVTITLVSTARNIAAIRASAAASAASISLHALPFVPANHGLPDDCESTSALPVAQFLTLFEAFESLEPAFDALVSSLRRDDDDAGAGGVCIVADPTVAWTVDVARRHGCAHTLYLSCSALGSAILHALWRNMPALPFGPDGVLRLRLPEHQEEEVALHQSQLSTIFLEADGVERWTAFQRRRMQYGYRTDAVIVNTVEELEPRGLAMVRRTLGDDVSVYPVGPLVRGVGETEGDGGHGAAVIGWMNTQRPASVLYISFGSQNSIRPKQMTELAGALELTGCPFVWAIRAPVGLKHDAVGMPWLPDGFEERARDQNRGRLVRGWAPQVSILAHASTGGFLSHCGWNSVLESLTQGVPIIGWPVSAEQFYNAKMLQEEWGVCVEAARGNVESSVVCRSKLAEVMESVMGDTDTAGRMRRRVVDVHEMLRKAWDDDGGSSRTALHGFFTAMRLVNSSLSMYWT